MDSGGQLDSRRKRLIADIHAAFADVRLDDGISLYAARALDHHAPPSQLAEANRRHHPEMQWPWLQDNEIEWFSDTLPFMDPKGIRFYLPRFMVWSLANAHASNSDAADNLIYLLDIGDLFPEDHLERYFALLTCEQRRVVAAFLAFIVDSAGEALDDTFDDVAAKRALDRYWHKYLNPP